MNVGTPEIFEQAQINVLGEEHVAPMIAFGTFKKRAAFKLFARTQNLDFELANAISEQIGKYEEALKYADDDERDEIDLFDYVDEKYRVYIEKSEPYLGITSDRKKAPSAYLLYQGNIRKEIGLIKCKSESTKKEYITCVIDGAIAENYKFLKNDILKVDVVLLIEKIFKRIGIEHFNVNKLLELIENDEEVWKLYEDGYTIGLNQCEKDSTTKKAMKYKPKNVSELSAFIAAIRPGFKSMYSRFESREDFKWGVDVLDDLLRTEQLPVSFLFFQEQVMSVLNYAGFKMDECYGIIKAIAKKHPEKVRPLKARFIEGFKQRIEKDEKLAEETALEYATDVWNIVNDNCGYGFNSAHAYCMALDSLYNAWQKAHYPYEFYEVMLQHFSDKGKKDKVSLLKAEMYKAFGISEGQYKFGIDNRKFIADKDKKIIIPSLASIKGLSQECANDLYEVGKNKFKSFVEILFALKETSVKSNQLETLIKIEYFSKYGDINELLEVRKIVDTYSKRSEIKKNELDGMGISEDIIRKFATSETETRIEEIDCEKYLSDKGLNPNEELDCMKFKYIKDETGKTKEKVSNGFSTKKTLKKYPADNKTLEKYAKKIVVGRFSDIDMKGLLIEMARCVKFEKASVSDKLSYQNELLGYIYSKYPRVPEGYYFIQYVDDRYANKNMLFYQLKTGNVIQMKVKAKTLEEFPLKENDIINVLEKKEDNKWGRKDGKYYKKEEKETILLKYNYVR